MMFTVCAVLGWVGMVLLYTSSYNSLLAVTVIASVCVLGYIGGGGGLGGGAGWTGGHLPP